MPIYRSHTGGTKEFGHPGFELEDTDSSREFKKSLLMGYFLKDPHDTGTKAKLQKYMPFHRLSLEVFRKGMPARFSVKISYMNDESSRKEFLHQQNLKARFDMELPKGEYLAKFEIKHLLFFKKSKKIKFELKNDTERKINFS